ncbi:hypothetical protein RMCBS344292_08048 [Rhizopus microsporus]|nr:hypothetical protein RMCBS344292_08048 [Rhizopus microsporus]
MQLKVYYLLLLSTAVDAFQIQFFGSNRYHNKLAVASLRFIDPPTDIYTVKICVTNSKGSLDVVSTVMNVMVDSFGFTHFNFEEGLPVGSNYYFAAFAVNNPSNYATAGPITIYSFDNGSPTNSVTANAKETVAFPTPTAASKTDSPTNSVSGKTDSPTNSVSDKINSPTTGPTFPSTFNFPTQIPKPGSDNYPEPATNGSLPIPAIVGIAIGSAAVATVTVALVFFLFFRRSRVPKSSVYRPNNSSTTPINMTEHKPSSPGNPGYTSSTKPYDKSSSVPPSPLPPSPPLPAYTQLSSPVDYSKQQHPDPSQLPFPPYDTMPIPQHFQGQPNYTLPAQQWESQQQYSANPFRNNWPPSTTANNKEEIVDSLAEKFEMNESSTKQEYHQKPDFVVYQKPHQSS